MAPYTSSLFLALLTLHIKQAYSAAVDCCTCKSLFDERCGATDMCCGDAFKCVQWVGSGPEGMKATHDICYNERSGDFFTPDGAHGNLADYSTMAIPFTEGSGAGIMDDLVDDRHELRERADGPTFPTPQLHFVTVTYTATSCDEMDMIRTSIITDCTPIAPGPTPDPPLFPSDAVVDPPQIIPTDDPYEDPSQTAISIPDPIVTDPAVTDPTVIDPEILGDTVPDLPATGPPVTDPLTSDPPLPTDNEQASSYPVPSVTSSEEASVSSAASSSTLSVKSTSIRVITTTLPPKSPEEYEDPPSTTETAGETVRPSPELVTGNGNSMHGSLGWICALSGIVASHYLL